MPERSSTRLERVDTGNIPLEHAHTSLVLMTTAMQATFGTLTVLVFAHALDTVSISLLPSSPLSHSTSPSSTSAAPPTLGALKMWRCSWLSREVLFFTLSFAAIGLCALSAWAGATAALHPSHFAVLAHLQHAIHGAATHFAPLTLPAGYAAVVFCICGTLASAFINLVKARPSWNPPNAHRLLPLLRPYRRGDGRLHATTSGRARRFR